jgi:predicted nuclease of predicted toxin-antitoxin system
MKIWLDAHLSPALAEWLEVNYAIEAAALRDLGLRDATDQSIFQAARQSDVVVMTKDRDFVDLVGRLGTPPQVIWLTFGNTSNQRLRQILRATLPRALSLLESGEPIVEISDITGQ